MAGRKKSSAKAFNQRQVFFAIDGNAWRTLVTRWAIESLEPNELVRWLLHPVSRGTCQFPPPRAVALATRTGYIKHAASTSGLEDMGTYDRAFPSFERVQRQ